MPDIFSESTLTYQPNFAELEASQRATVTSVEHNAKASSKRTNFGKSQRFCLLNAS